MIDTKRKGKRCRATRLIRIHAGIVAPSSQGTIAYEMENLGRQLIRVQWDMGSSTYVFPDEIEIMAANGSAANL